MNDFGGSIKKTDDYEIAVLGIPYDEKSSYLRGAAKGPRAIREASTGEAINAWTESGLNLGTDTSIADLGDMDVSGPFTEVFFQIEKKTFEILKQGAKAIVLGGDHSITYPVVKGFEKTHHPLDILHFDAHPDLYEELYGDRFSHACPFTRILEEGLVANLVQVGIRAATGPHKEWAQAHQVRMIPMKDLHEALELHFVHPLYISFDMDALDPAFAPGVSHHEPGGLSTRQVIDMIHALDADIVGMDMVEVNPDRDPSGITAAAAVKIIKEIMGRMVISKKSKQKETT